MRRVSCLFSLLLLLSGCDSDNPVSSSRSFERLIVGSWVVPNPAFFVEEFEDWRHIIFEADGTFLAPWGIGGPRLLEFTGKYWVHGRFLGTRGVGGAEGEGALHVQFAELSFSEWKDPDALGLIITEIRTEYIASLGKPPEGMSSDDVQDMLKKLNDTPPPPDALGTVYTYQKVSRPIR